MLGLESLPGGLGLKEKWESAANFGLVPSHLQGLKIGATPSREVFTRGNLRLLAYEPLSGSSPTAETRAPVLFLPSLINRHYILDLMPGRSLVEHLLREGFPVYMIEWLPPRPEDQYLTFDDLFSRRIARAISETCSDSGFAKIHLIGHCLGGTLAAMESLLRPQRLKSLTLLTAPIDFQESGKLGVWAKSSDLDLRALTDAYGNIPWALLQTTFQMLKPALALSKLSRLMERWKDPEFLQMFLAIEMWSSDNISFPGLCYEALIRDLYQKNQLAKGEIRVEGQKLNLEELSIPTLEVIALDDHIVPPQTRLPELTGASHGITIQKIDLNGGHIGSILGKRAQQSFWPEMTQWLKSQESEKH